MKFFDVYNKMNLHLVKGQGNTVFAKDGTRYTDFYGGHAVISVGHGHPYYIERMKKQLERLAYYSNAVFIDEQESLAATLSEFIKEPLSQLFMVNSGAEAIENAVKLASFITKKKKIVSFKGGFHGRTSLAVQITDQVGLCSGVNEGLESSKIPFNDFEAAEEAIDQGVAAVVIEAIQGVGGCRQPTPQFLEFLRARCSNVNALLIFDEIQSGCGRTGEFFSFSHHGVKADIVTMAKGIGNGFPVGAVVIDKSIEAVKGSLGTTFGGNQMACTAFQSVLEIIKQEDLMVKAGQLGTFLNQELSKIKGISSVLGRGLMVGFELEPDKDAAKLRSRLLTEGQFITGYSPATNTIRLLPPLTITQHEIEKFLHKTEELLL